MLIHDRPVFDERARRQVEAGTSGASIYVTFKAAHRITLAIEPDRSQAAQFSSRCADPGGSRPPTRRIEVDVQRVEAAFARPAIVVREMIACRRRTTSTRNVILLVANTLRADRLGCCSPGTLTPISIGSRRKHATSAPSRRRRGPSRPPPRCSVVSSRPRTARSPAGSGFLADQVVTLAECFQRSGFATAAFVANDLISPLRNFDQGFDSFLVAGYANARQLDQLFLDWLADHREQPFFAYLHYYDPHAPYNAPPPRGREHVPPSLARLDHDQAVMQVIEAMRAGDIGRARDELDLLAGLYAGEGRVPRPRDRQSRRCD
ncbi:MAG: sulfatase-like hydrolase/transferase [Planctomycetota bacterium]